MTGRTQAFLAAYRETGQVAKAARAAEIDRTAHYKRLRRDPEYARAFREAEKEAAEILEDRAVEWAFDGVEEPVIYQGALCLGSDGRPLTRRRRSEALAMFLLKGKLPEKYRRTEVAPPPIDDGKQTWEEFLAVYYRRSSAQEGGATAAPAGARPDVVRERGTSAPQAPDSE